MSEIISVPKELLEQVLNAYEWQLDTANGAASYAGSVGPDETEDESVTELRALLQAPAQPAQAHGCLDGDQLIELLERARLEDEDARPHGNGATYWNNAVFMCQTVIRDALAAAPKPPVQCPAYSERIVPASTALIQWAWDDEPESTLFDEGYNAARRWVKMQLEYAVKAPQPSDDVAISKMARILSDREASACCVDPDDQWKIYGQEFIDDVRAMLEGSKGDE